MFSTISTEKKTQNASGLNWSVLTNLGFSSSDSPYFSRKIALSNQISAIVFVVGLALTIGFVFTDIPKATINWFLALLAVLALVPVLNHLNFRTFSRHVLSTLLPLFLIFFVAHIRASFPDSVHGASFYIPRFFLLAISFMPLILFGYEEKKHLFASFGINVILLLSYNNFMEFLGAGMGIAETPVQDPFFVSISSVLALVIVSLGYFFLNSLNSEYELQIEALLAKTKEQNKSMNDAVTYATNIQKVVLPQDEVLERLSDKLFVLFKPLHTVSGDFYLVEEHGDTIMFSVIDCTGHGVPGAFMSILANSAIQSAITAENFDDPSNIMEKANALFHQDLLKSGNPNIKDGMDMVICSYNKSTSVLKAAGANIGVYVIDESELIEHAVDKGGICVSNPKRKFSSIEIQLERGQSIFISSDGYRDQFGGVDDKKLGKRRFKEILQKAAVLPLFDQRNFLNDQIESWKSARAQVDDICLIGFKA